jgi:hypothetical protein
VIEQAGVDWKHRGSLIGDEVREGKRTDVGDPRV